MRVTRIRRITPKDLQDLCKTPEAVRIVDVRSASQFRAGCIPGAESHPIKKGVPQYALLPQDRLTVFYCA